MTAIMRGNRKRDTRPEVQLRSALHRAGARFRKDYAIRPGSGRVIRVDIAFPRARLAVFVDGCFWHCCPVHGNDPRVNVEYWQPKLARNRQRDSDVDRRLHDAGWHVVRVWEHDVDSPATAHGLRECVLEARRAEKGGGGADRSLR
jgi:DNA mismatch endonuclease (patch repair protein)